MRIFFSLNKTFSDIWTVIVFELTVFRNSKIEAVDFLINKKNE